ncbi:hypothetical protein DSO57_1032029 [Entomophthora muscae]|uniref:Uncharacterized protein n=1 Tax=Entomophthora muscae TaxID=34485 RepID=A0ACC2TBK9_9FUNG|nr:hypothetical protein DSO57_1032029 [Entomophthora muscae]
MLCTLYSITLHHYGQELTNLDLHSADHTSPTPLTDQVSVSSSLNLENNNLVPLQAPGMPAPVPTCTPWLLTSLVLMGLNVYFPQFPLCPLFGPPSEQLSHCSTGRHPGGGAQRVAP